MEGAGHLGYVCRAQGRAAGSDCEARNSPMKFTPAADSGARALADAFGSSAEQRSALVEAFAQIKQGVHEAEVAKEGKSNNLAAAMTFFIAASVVAYNQTEMLLRRHSRNEPRPATALAEES